MDSVRDVDIQRISMVSKSYDNDSAVSYTHLTLPTNA